MVASNAWKRTAASWHIGRHKRLAIGLAAVCFLVALFANKFESCAWAAPPTVQQPEVRQLAAQQPFAPAFVVSGTPRERGLAYGKHFKDGIHEFLSVEIYDAFVGHPASKQEMLAYAAECGKVAKEVCPMIAEECEGIAEGAGISFDEVVLIHSHEEVYHLSTLPMHGHCTAVAVAPSDTGDGHTYVGQTWDWMTRVAGKSSVVEWRRKEGPSVLAYGFPGMAMGAGLNSDGIALCWTSANLDKKPKQSPRVGVPSYMLIAHLLAQSDVESVIREARRDKHAGWFTFVMADGEGNLVNIEGSPLGVAIERPKDRLARAYFGTREMTGAEPGQVPGYIRAASKCTNLWHKRPARTIGE